MTYDSGPHARVKYDQRPDRFAENPRVEDGIQEPSG